MREWDREKAAHGRLHVSGTDTKHAAALDYNQHGHNWEKWCRGVTTFLRNVKMDNDRKVRIKETGPRIWTTGFGYTALHRNELYLSISFNVH